MIRRFNINLSILINIIFLAFYTQDALSQFDGSRVLWRHSDRADSRPRYYLTPLEACENTHHFVYNGFINPRVGNIASVRGSCFGTPVDRNTGRIFNERGLEGLDGVTCSGLFAGRNPDERIRLLCNLPADDRPDKNAGRDCNEVGNPCNPATGNKFQRETDFSFAGLEFIRSYNSNNLVDLGLGHGWRMNFQPRMTIIENDIVLVSSSGKGEPWTKNGDVWKGDSDTDLLLEQEGDEFVVLYSDDRSERYGASGQLLMQTDSNGFSTTYTYDEENQLIEVKNHYGKTISFSYLNRKLEKVTDPQGFSYRYSYDSSQNLVSVIYPDLTLGDDLDNPRRTYHYENTRYPNHLTGITDENGDRYASWAYDNAGKAMSSEHAQTTSSVGQEKVELLYSSGLVNIALNKATEQSSTGFGGISSRAVDGNVNGNFFSSNSSVSHTVRQDQPWWQVDIGSQSQILNIILFNRTDCCSDVLVDFYVFVSEAPFANQSLPQILANDSIDRVYHEGTLSSSSINIQLLSKGRYVRVQLAGNGAVSLAEVQVIGREEN